MVLSVTFVHRTLLKGSSHAPHTFHQSMSQIYSKTSGGKMLVIMLTLQALTGKWETKPLLSLWDTLSF